jgi:hypothetical protein
VALEALEVRGQFNAIDPTSRWKIDFIARKELPFSRADLERRETATV